MIPQYIVMTAAAAMPSSCWGRYGKVAVVETDCRHMPRQIHPNHRAVVRIVQVWDRLNRGSTDRCAFVRAETEAEKLAARLNTVSIYSVAA